jgi:N-methylhydantoinase A/oxoprolinase/acetone carboxylase beta subunit
MFTSLPDGLDTRETAVANRLLDGPQRVSHAVTTRMENPALTRLVTRGMVMIAGVTPSDASHVLGRVDAWDTEAAKKALTLFARRRVGSGDRVASGPEALSQMIIDQLTHQTVDCLLQAAFDEDDWQGAEALARHPLTMAGLGQHRGIVEVDLKLGVPVIGLGASAAAYYGAVGARLNTRMVLPEHAGVANAIGAVVGQVAMHASGAVTSPGAGAFAVHLPDGVQKFITAEEAMNTLEVALRREAGDAATAAGVEEIRFTVDRDIKEVDIEGQPMFIEATVKVTAQGRPRIADG